MYIYKCVYNCVNSICKQDYSLWSLETATPEKYLLKSCWLVIQKAQIQAGVWIGQEGASLELSTSVQTTSIHCESEVKWLEGGRLRARTWEEGGGYWKLFYATQTKPGHIGKFQSWALPVNFTIVSDSFLVYRFLPQEGTQRSLSSICWFNI